MWAFALVISALAGASAAQPASDAWQFATAPKPAVWSDLTQPLGLKAVPPDARAFGIDWVDGCSGPGFVRALVMASGDAYAAASWTPGEPPVRLERGDLVAFEAALQGSDFATRPAGSAADSTDTGVDCYVIGDVAAEVDGRFKQTEVEGGGVSLAYAELYQIVAARTGQPRATPGGWWSEDLSRAPRPAVPPYAAVPCAGADAACRAPRWADLLAWLELPDLKPQQRSFSAYRLVIFDAAGAARYVDISTLSAPNEMTICAVRRRQGRATQADPPDCLGEALIQASGHRPRRIPLAALQDIEARLAAAGFATAPAGSPCARSPSWVLEAMVGDRYRFAAGGACAPGPLDAVFRNVAKLG